MHLFSYYHEKVRILLERRKTLVLFAALYAICLILGIVFIKTPSVYEYHFRSCERFLNRVCYSQTNVVLIFLKRTLGCCAYLALISVCSVHIIPACAMIPTVLCYRAYTFGGAAWIFVSVYKMSGVFVLLVLYVPIRLLCDFIYVCCSVCSFARVKEFSWQKRDFAQLFSNFIRDCILIVAVCLFEMILLLVLYHPIGALL